MKQTLLFFFTLIVAVNTMSFEDIAERIASTLEVMREEVQTCFHKTNATLEDLMRVDELIYENRLQIIDFDASALKAGCFFACLCQKKGVMTGARVNMDHIKKMIHSNKARPNQLAKVFQILDFCANQVRSKTNECEVSLKYILCVVNKMIPMDSNNNNDE
ncbi:pheromone-binding protein Gp-9-like isoform X2 [Odontomachus brunneus]|uniref:pheromone-binding protein Gp-9-like isoform X2 n=1 Tax=Odontomachus brunneus TaxID=486640 RepID=UPI0013F22D22|nr:pheromone-binding protein Gp-9-like isoform X2 [Odontomachus brunneus]